ncbi:MAG TPA: diaminopimelate epimerase [Acidimicrobiales bacterium]|nr:diaminopimelate epimerase [Acidimicrobiales bacterium]
MQLTKHHGLGNDFLVLLDLDATTTIDAELARSLCHRRMGVGADGLIRVSPGTDGADVTMTLRNADGSLAEMSGNGIRCLAQAVARARGAEVLGLTVATGGGRRRVGVAPGPDPLTAWVEVDMGPARPGPGDWLVDVGLDPATKMATVDLGNPHLVLLVDDPAAVDLAELGPRLAERFDHGTNVEVVAPDPNRHDTLVLRVWERGAGITQACGTGAAAAAHACHGWGLVGERVVVRMPGGELEVHLGASVTLVGPATFVADVEVPV